MPAVCRRGTPRAASPPSTTKKGEGKSILIQIYPGVYGDAYPRLHAHSLGLRADWVIDPTNDQTGAFWPGEPHRADVILEARADLRYEWPAACGGLSALQGPQPPAQAVVANSPARCSSLISLTNHEPVPLERCPQHVCGSPTRCKMGAQRHTKYTSLGHFFSINNRSIEILNSFTPKSASFLKK